MLSPAAMELALPVIFRSVATTATVEVPVIAEVAPKVDPSVASTVTSEPAVWVKPSVLPSAPVGSGFFRITLRTYVFGANVLLSGTVNISLVPSPKVIALAPTVPRRTVVPSVIQASAI
ncbi:MAG: hypothetical protein WCK00_14155 [Deltaproteobacteria bacterium]